MQDSDYNTRTPRKTFAGAFAGGAAAAGGAGGMLSGDLAAAGTPSNMGKIGDSGGYSLHILCALLILFHSTGGCGPAWSQHKCHI